MRFSSTLALAIVSKAYAVTIGPTVNLFIGNKFIAPDGFNRSSVLAGATASSVSFPGPLIKGTKGDTFTINVVDGLVDTNMLTSTSIHWHGIFQSGSSWADGPVGVTQCPIKAGDSFEYRFKIHDQAGTFWYHSHYSTQYCDGLRGPLVVYDPNDPYKSRYDFDDESTIITLADWYHEFAHILGAQEKPASPDATLINGKGRTSSNPTADLAVITVIPNKRYRFRLISLSCDPNFTFSIDKHNLIIIEVDGENVRPLTVDSIQIFAGQRYSFILQANKQISNYWIRADPNLGTQSFENGMNSAILRYAGAPAREPTTVSSSTNPLLETRLHPLTNPAAPGIPQRGKADVNLNFEIGYNFDTGKFEMNNHSFVDPGLPVLLQILSGHSTAQELLPAETLYLLPPNKVIEISIPGGSLASPHPMHLHGHSFSVIRSAGSDVYNYNNPVRRDVVNVGSDTNDNVTIRFVTDNAGPWTFHCHIDWHLDRGFTVIFAEDVPTVANERPPTAWTDLCN